MGAIREAKSSVDEEALPYLHGRPTKWRHPCRAKPLRDAVCGGGSSGRSTIHRHGFDRPRRSKHDCCVARATSRWRLPAGVEIDVRERFGRPGRCRGDAGPNRLARVDEKVRFLDGGGRSWRGTRPRGSSILVRSLGPNLGRHGCGFRPGTGFDQRDCRCRFSTGRPLMGGRARHSEKTQEDHGARQRQRHEKRGDTGTASGARGSADRPTSNALIENP